MFEVVFQERARKSYERLPSKVARLVDKAIPILERDPFSGPNIRRLHGELDGLFRLRVGSYRIIYEIDGQSHVVIILTIGSRESVY